MQLIINRAEGPDMATVDVTVMGAGVFGLSVAYACLGRGARVRVIDPNGVGAGASGGIVGALAPHVPENWNAKKAFQLESLLMQGAFWKGVDDLSGLASGYARNGRLQPLADAQALALAHARAQTAVALWSDKASWTVQAASNADWSPPSPSGHVVFDTLSGLLHPAKATASLAGAVTALGGEIVTAGAVQGQTVWATGWADLQGMTAQHHRLVGNGIKGQAALLDFDATGLPQLFADTLHIVPHNDGTVAIGSTSERAFDDDTATDTQLDDIVERAKSALPILADAKIIKRWAGVRPRSRSRAPILGEHPFKARDFIANGGFKIGFGMAPKVGHVMADLILENRDTIPNDFKPERSL